jgi:membrane protein
MEERGISPFPTPEAEPVPALPDERVAGRPDVRALLGGIRRTLMEVGPFGLAAQVAYSLIFALPSIVLIVVVIAVAVGRWTGVSPLDALEPTVARNLAPGLGEPFRSLEENAMRRAAEPGPTLSAIVSAVAALVIAGSGVRVLSRACIRASGETDDRPLWSRQLLSIGVALLLAALLVGAFALILFEEALWIAVTRALFGAPVESAGVRVVRAIAEVFVVFGFLLTLYKTSLGRAWPWRAAAVGAVVATPLWFVAGKAFQVYLHVSDPGSAYGAANSALILLMFLYVSSLILIVGALATATARRRQRSALDSGKPAAAH